MRYYPTENAMVIGGADIEFATEPTLKQAQAAACTDIERRLARLNMVKARLEDAKEEYEMLRHLGAEAARHNDSSLVRLISPGMCLTPQEVHTYQLNTLATRISADGREVKKLCGALGELADDDFYQVLELYYDKGLSDAAIGTILGYDRSTIYRHRRRLINRLACRLYMI